MFTLTHSSSGYRSKRRHMRDSGVFAPWATKEPSGGRKPRDKK
jgi:hypothetical protein